MLAAIWSVLELYIRELFKHRLSVREKNNSWKRTAIGKFMALHESLFELEKVSLALYRDFSDLSAEKGVLAKVVIKRHIKQLAESFRQFVKCQREVDSLLSIYDDPLWIGIPGVREIKGAAWRTFELWVDALPTNDDLNGNATSVITYRQYIPTKDVAKRLAKSLNFPTHDRDELEKDVKRIKKEILSKIDVVSIDMLDKEQVRGQLEILRTTFEALSTVRKDLAEFIRVSFPLEKIMNVGN